MCVNVFSATTCQPFVRQIRDVHGGPGGFEPKRSPLREIVQMTSSKKAESAEFTALAGPEIEKIAKLNSSAIEVFVEACQAYANGMASLNGDMMNFVRARAARDAELGQALSRCDDWADVANLQQEWAKQTAEDYLKEAQRLMALASKVANEGWEPVRRRADETMVALKKTED
jgi:hypothetical protein